MADRQSQSGRGALQLGRHHRQPVLLCAMPFYAGVSAAADVPTMRDVPMPRDFGYRELDASAYVLTEVFC